MAQRKGKKIRFLMILCVLWSGCGRVRLVNFHMLFSVRTEPIDIMRYHALDSDRLHSLAGSPYSLQFIGKRTVSH